MNKETMLDTSDDYAVIQKTVFKECFKHEENPHDRMFSGQIRIQTNVTNYFNLSIYT